MSSKPRSIILDFLKGLAIVAVAFYHFDAWLPYGYLGVDVFFVISGFLFVKSLSKSFKENSFNYWSFLIKKIVRLWPLILIVSAVAVVYGYFLMLPDDYENLAESAVASTLFANNILQAITTKNYWDIVNLYKPLMHMWYVDVLMQAYVILPLFYFIGAKLLKKSDKKELWTGLFLTVVSLVLFLLPLPQEWKFYYLPFRVFELSIGGLIASKTIEVPGRKALGISVVSLAVILVMLCSPVKILSPAFMLLTVVAATTALVFVGTDLRISCGICNVIARFFAALGQRSYSIYIWHQFVIAFLFYSVFPYRNLTSFLVFAAITAVLSEISYRVIESKLGAFIKRMGGGEFRFVILNSVFATLLCGASLLIYMNAGVVRDVPELNVSMDKVKRGMHAEYVDIPRHMKIGFEDGNKQHILIFGNSFGRDWANILREYDKDGTLEITYLVNSEENVSKFAELIAKADKVFYAEGPSYVGVPEYMEVVPKEKLFVIGNKNFGESNGIIYARRSTENYFSQRVVMPEGLKEQNIRESEKYGDHYINLMQAVTDGSGMVQVFTDDNKFISQDCRHLTKAGAQYFSRILDIKAILGQKYHKTTE